MAKYKFETNSPKDSASTFDLIKKFLSADNEFKKFDPKISCQFDEAAKKCSVKGAQFSATIAVKDSGSKASQIQVEYELPLALALFKGKVQEMLSHHLSKILK